MVTTPSEDVGLIAALTNDLDNNWITNGATADNLRKLLASLASKDEEIAALKKELASRTDLSRASPSPATSATRWQDIETAPRDGEVFLAYGPSRYEVVFYDPAEPDGSGIWTAGREHFHGREEWCFGTQDGPSLHRDIFTHWMPLPAIPTLGDRLADEEQHRNEPASGLQGDVDA